MRFVNCHITCKVCDTYLMWGHNTERKKKVKKINIMLEFQFTLLHSSILLYAGLCFKHKRNFVVTSSDERFG